MSASFPSGVFSPRVVVDRAGVTYDASKTKVLFAKDKNDADAEIVAIETELGVNPKGAFASVAAYLYALYLAIVVKCTGAEINTGTNDTKFATPKAIADSNLGNIAKAVPWVSWSPIFPHGLTIGNGVVTGAYTQNGKKVTARLNIVFGSSTSVDSYITISLPVAAISYPGGTSSRLGLARIFDYSTNDTYYSTIGTFSTVACILQVDSVNGSYLKHVNTSATIPLTWAVGDEIVLQFMYEVG